MTLPKAIPEPATDECL